MAEEAEMYNMEDITFTENKSRVKKELEDIEEYIDHKSDIKMSDIELKNCLRNDNIKEEYEVSTITTCAIKELSASETCNAMIDDTVKAEDEVSAVVVIKSEFNNRQLFCEHCNEYYEDYCTKCEMLVFILNRNTLSGTENTAREEIPSDILEIKDSFGQLGVFAMKIIPKGVKFGPFRGLSVTEGCLRLKAGKFTVTEDKSKFLNWMQYINPARNVSEQNLLVFQYEDNIYYRSSREIQADEQILVYFGEEYEDSLHKDVEINFIPIAEKDTKDVFACTYCCLGFSSGGSLVKHKGICLKDINGKFSIEELTQCSFCHIFLGEKEYLEYHIIYCHGKNDRTCIPLRVEENSSKAQRRHIYKCIRCNYKTTYKSDLINHANTHYQVKMYKCGVCYRRFKTKERLKAHMENVHVNAEGNETQKYSTTDNIKAETEPKHSDVQFKCLTCDLMTERILCEMCQASTKQNLKCHLQTKHLKEFSYACAACNYKTNRRLDLETHTKNKHLKAFKYKCEMCQFKTYWKKNLESHLKTKHVKEYKYECQICGYKASSKSNLNVHIKAKHRTESEYKCVICNYKTHLKGHLQRHITSRHLNTPDYKCDLCEFKTKSLRSLRRHTKTKHLKEFNYKCDTCGYETNYKAYLEIHTKTKHLQEFVYNCETCEFKTNQKAHFEYHTKTKHLKEFKFKCESCKYETNNKSRLSNHIKSKHLKEFKYKCEACEFKTNEKFDVDRHVKSKHLGEFDYKCEICDYKTNHKTAFTKHVRTKHLREFNYKCEMCEFGTNDKVHLKKHTKTRHLKEFDHNCDMCRFKTNERASFERHRRAVHQI